MNNIQNYKLLIYGLREKIRIKERAIGTQTILLDEYRKEIKNLKNTINELKTKLNKNRVMENTEKNLLEKLEQLKREIREVEAYLRKYPIEGKMAIFYTISDHKNAVVGIFTKESMEGSMPYFCHYRFNGKYYTNAMRYDNQEQFRELINRENIPFIAKNCKSI